MTLWGGHITPYFFSFVYNVLRSMPNMAAVFSLYTAMEEFEKRFITKAFEHNQGNRKNTAAMLGIDRKTLYTKLKKYGVIWSYL